MPDRSILFEELKTPQDIFALKEHLRELYRLLDKRFVNVTFSATPTFDSDEGDVFLITLTANITGITLKNAYQGRTITILFKQGGVGGYTIAWTTIVKLAGAVAIGPDAVGEYSTITLTYDGTNWVEIGRTADVK